MKADITITIKDVEPTDYLRAFLSLSQPQPPQLKDEKGPFGNCDVCKKPFKKGELQLEFADKEGDNPKKSHLKCLETYIQSKKLMEKDD